MATRKQAKATLALPEHRGRGRWLVASFLPVTPFSLRLTHANSKGGKAHLIPTPYSVKMALIDACFRLDAAEDPGATARRMFDLVKGREIRVRPPRECVVQNTFIRVLDHDRDGDFPFKRTIAYREFVHHGGGPLELAIGVAEATEAEVGLAERGFLHVNYLGKRGGFLQFAGTRLVEGDLDGGFSVPLTELRSLPPAGYGVVRDMDDFGDKLCAAKDGFDRVSTYGDKPVTLGEHRVLVPSLIPVRQQGAGRSYTWFRATSQD